MNIMAYRYCKHGGKGVTDQERWTAKTQLPEASHGDSGKATVGSASVKFAHGLKGKISNSVATYEDAKQAPLYGTCVVAW